MQVNSTNRSASEEYTRCLGIYHLLDRPSGDILSTYVSVIAILSMFSVLSALGNGVIIYVYLKQKSLQCTNTLLLICLAFLDFVSAVILEPLYVVRLLSEIFGFTSCVYILIVRRLFEYLRPVSFMTLALITIERYLALFKAITHRRIVTKVRILRVVFMIWFVWFWVICIRSFFPKFTSAFYTFFTFVACSLLAGNLLMYVKIGKLARLHSRPTQRSTAQGSLSVWYESRGTVSRRSATEDSVQCGLNVKRHSSTRIKIQPAGGSPQVTKINVEPHGNTSKSKVFSKEDEQCNTSTQDVDLTTPNKATDAQQSPNTLNAETELPNTSNCKTQADTCTSKSNLKAFEKATDFEAGTTKEQFQNNETKDLHTAPTSNAMFKPELCDHSIKADSTNDTNNNSLPSIKEENSPKDESISEISRENNHQENIVQGTSRENTSTSRNVETNNAQETACCKSEATLENTTQDENVRQVDLANIVEKTEDVQKETAQNRKIPQVAQTSFEETKSQIGNASEVEEKTKMKNNDSSREVKNAKKRSKMKSRLSLKNTAKRLMETRERNATWTVFYIVAILAICYLPISILLIHLSFHKEPNATLLFVFLPIADTIALLNALVNPFVYCLKNRKMRNAVKNVLQRTRGAS